MIASDGNRTRGDRLIDKTRAIGPAAGEREEYLAGLHRTAVHRETRHGYGSGMPVHHDIIAEKFAKFHGVPVRPRLGACFATELGTHAPRKPHFVPAVKCRPRDY
jgi:hypothetical protein